MASNGEKFTCFLIGGFVGATIALLFAPRSGEETRSMIENRYREGADLVGQKARSGKDAILERSRDVGDRLTQKVDEGRDALNRQKEQLSQAVEAGKRAYEEEKLRLSKANGEDA